MDTSPLAPTVREDPRLLVEAIYTDDDSSDPFHLLQRELIVQVLQHETNFHLTYDTIIIRLLQRVAETFRLPWTTVLETTRHCYLPPILQTRLFDWWKERVKPVTIDEQHCVERVLGRDHVRVTDLLKLAGCMHKLAPTPKDVWIWFAVDGFLGDDPKKYVDATFKLEERTKHVHAVRTIYEQYDVQSPEAMKDILETIYRGQDHEARDVYLATVGGWEAAKQMAEWMETKRKKVEGESNRKRASSSSNKEGSSKGSNKEGGSRKKVKKESLSSVVAAEGTKDATVEEDSSSSSVEE